MNKPFLGALALAILGSGSCGGGSTPSAPTPPSGPPTLTNTITIGTAGVSPQNVEVAAGTRVLFINNGGRAHNMSSDPHPDHTDCPEINQVGFLAPGQSRETGNLVTPRTCKFHDHDLPSDLRLQGSIVIR